MIKPIGLACVVLLMAAGSAIPTGEVKLAARPGSTLDATARKVASADLADANGQALVLIGSQRLGTAGTGPALFVEIQSDRTCGSAGCSISVYLPTAAGWTKVMDAVGGQVLVDPAEHRGMHDLVVNQNDRWAWNGQAYADTQPAPQVDLRPRRRPTRPVHRRPA